MVIKFYKTHAPYGFLNNYTISRMFIYGRWWNNVETAYQSRKTLDQLEVIKVYNCKTPREARDLGQKVKLRPDWDNVRDQVMYECVLAKFLQNSSLQQQLISTYPNELIEDSPVDSYWGCGIDGNGQNMLGKILMRIRSELING